MQTPQEIVTDMQEARRELEIEIFKINANLKTCIKPNISRFLNKEAKNNNLSEWADLSVYSRAALRAITGKQV